MNGEIIDSSSSVDVDAEVRFVGGLVGRMGDNTDLVLRSSSTGDVSSGSNSRATGGLVGESWGVINESYSTGDVSSPGSESGLSLDGGLVGESGFGASVNYVYATGNVSDAEDRKGGLFGSLTDISVEEGYFAGDIISGGGSTEGALAGSTNSDTDLFDVYWDAEVNRLSDSSEAVGDNEGSTNVTSGEFNLQTSDMQGSNAESEMSELDFDNVWTTTSGYPEFQWQE